MLNPQPSAWQTVKDTEVDVYKLAAQEIRATQIEWVSQQNRVMELLEELQILIDREIAELHTPTATPPDPLLAESAETVENQSDKTGKDAGGMDIAIAAKEYTQND